MQIHRYLNPSWHLFPGASRQLCEQQMQPEYLSFFCPCSQLSANPSIIARMPYFSPPGGWYPRKTVHLADEITSELGRYPPKYLSVSHSSLKELSRDITTCCNKHIILLRVSFLTFTLSLRQHLNLNCHQVNIAVANVKQKDHACSFV